GRRTAVLERRTAAPARRGGGRLPRAGSPLRGLQDPRRVDPPRPHGARMVRLHVASVPEAGGAAGEVSVKGPRLHYLRAVLRLREGDALEVFDGRGGAYDATVTRLGTDEARLRLGPRREAAPRRRISVVQGLPKAEKLELVIQKGTELGAAAFAPAFAARSVV